MRILGYCLYRIAQYFVSQNIRHFRQGQARDEILIAVIFTFVASHTPHGKKAWRGCGLRDYAITKPAQATLDVSSKPFPSLFGSLSTQQCHRQA